jgi:hypothetical protein
MAPAIVPAGAAAGAATAPVGRPQHCVVNVTSQLPSGELQVSESRCFGSITEARASGASFRSSSKSGGVALMAEGDIWLTTHYDGAMFTGASFSVFGPSCSGWLNMTWNWNNRISSSESDCAVWHFDGVNRTGAVEMIVAPGGTLTGLDNRTGSVQYT